MSNIKEQDVCDITDYTIIDVNQKSTTDNTEEQCVHKVCDVPSMMSHCTIVNINTSANARLSLVDDKYNRDKLIEEAFVLSGVAYEPLLNKGNDILPRFLPLTEDGRYGLHIHTENSDNPFILTLRYYSIVKIKGDL